MIPYMYIQDVKQIEKKLKYFSEETRNKTPLLF